MKNKFLATLIFGLVLSANSIVTSSAHANPGDVLDDTAYLYKLSMSLRGIPPGSDEYQQLNSAENNQSQAQFLNNKIAQYLQSPQYRDHMVYLLSELFEITPPAVSQWEFDKQSTTYIISMTGNGNSSSPDNRSAITDLFAQIASQNLSWDSLLTMKDYVAYGGGSVVQNFAGETTDYSFFSLLDPQLPFDGQGAVTPNYRNQNTAPANSTNYQNPIAVHFSPDDLRVAGAVTTARFMDRYTTTGLNKDRRRAAAVFRIFMCDSMVPAISSGVDRTHEFLDAAFAEKFEVTESDIRNSMMSNANARHGTDPQCMACHYKLDPLGRTFQNIGVVASADPSPGAFVYKHVQDGTMTNVPLRGIGDLGKVVTQQPEYLSCQVKWFWKQFIGTDVQLYPDRLNGLVATFQNVGHRTDDFVTALVTSPEFRTEPKPSTVVTFSNVQPLLMRCDNCHANEQTSDGSNFPPFTKLPIGNPHDHPAWIQDMWKMMNLPATDRKLMPKGSNLWSQDDIDLVKKWLSQGAPDAYGNPTAPNPVQDAGGGQ